MVLKAVLRHPLRFAIKFPWAVGEATAAFADHLGRRRKTLTHRDRALWLQKWSRRTLRAFDVNWTVRGDVPHTGLLVSNHLSYLDVLVIAAITPAVFVAKSDVDGWPLFGALARAAGTIFVHRDKRADVARVISDIEAVEKQGVLVVIFPEGTSSDGLGVLPFRPSLLEPATAPAQPLSVACLSYTMAEGDPAQDVCYWGDMTMFPHMLKLVTRRSIQAAVRFSRIESRPADRKELAAALHTAVTRLQGERGGSSRSESGNASPVR